jgi:hypothetical protein
MQVLERQDSETLRLRAATKLARLQTCRGGGAKSATGLRLYGWFTEGFDTADSEEAKALLDELR